MYVHTYKPYFLKIYRSCDLSKILEELSSQVKKNDIIEDVFIDCFVYGLKSMLIIQPDIICFVTIKVRFGKIY